MFELSGNTYEYKQKLIDPSGAVNDKLGKSVAISQDGKYIIGGATEDDDISSNAGSLVVFELSGNTYIHKQNLVDPSGEKYDYLGYSVAISQDGTYIVGGATGDDDISSDVGSLSVFELKET